MTGASGADPPEDRAGDRPEDRIEQLITRLVQCAPANDDAASEELQQLLRRVGSPLARPLARSIARVLELCVEQLVAPGIALPYLAMACATLADGIRGRLGERELEAARYEIDTLMPVPDRPVIAAPDVPVASLLRKRT